MAQQTAVEWLEEKLNIWQTISDEDTNSTLNTVRKLLEQAKQMEKEQIEISDEEIDKIAKEYVLYNESKRNWVVEGMKLYREQLKNK